MSLQNIFFISLWLQNNTASPMINYLRWPEEFVTKFANCVRGECHLYYWHIPKTGGTTIEQSFNKMFFKTKKTTSSCCGESMEKHFMAKTASYCSSKFSSYQLSGAL